MKLRYAFLVLSIAALTSCSKITVEEETFVYESIDVVANSIEEDIFTIVNNYRVSIGKSELMFDVDTYNSASLHNDYMISKGKVSHDKFDYRASILSSKKKAKKVAENVAKDYDTAIDAFNGWLSSPTHRKAIEGDYTYSAVNAKKDKNGKYYFTQIFLK